MKTIVVVLFTSLFSFSQTIDLQSFASGFTEPVEIAHAGDSRLFVAEKGGLIKILNTNGSVNATPFLDVSTLTNAGGERGLLGLAFHPDFATNGYFFINYTNSSNNTVIARYIVSSNPDVATSTGVVLMTINQPYSNHNGGCLKFGTDGFLYIGMGDGGSGGDPQGYSQNLTIDSGNPTRVFLGKMLRIDVNVATTPYYSIPATNPYVGQTGKEEIWAIGLRNPWKFTFNKNNGDLWIADVGQNSIEEINKTVAPLTPGLNFGWRCYEGNSTYNTSGCVPMSSLTMPFAEYDHSGGNCSVTGGYVYTGTTYPNFQNKYFFADYCVNRIGYVDVTNGSTTYTSNFSGNAYYTTFGEDISGELYIAASANGTIYKIIDTSLNSPDFESNGFSLYPNPTSSSFTISNSTTVLIREIQLFDVTGKLVLTKDISENKTIHTSSLSKGIYTVTLLDNNNKRYNSKLVIQ
ncbi:MULTISPECIES: PQQ-dependent sugar dehydrogenase [Flavobacterium]|uniref:PQQ-dependent sugar dehydrogenase n=1 Tax=Flavobacterium jumunjinense TaxID=998845 RepID=A0ABV5GPT7_9FLAO|nr:MULTISPECIES: PQQ-dependent sugar dehydrogenase [Flavobacterium]